MEQFTRTEWLIIHTSVEVQRENLLTLIKTKYKTTPEIETLLSELRSILMKIDKTLEFTEP